MIKNEDGTIDTKWHRKKTFSDRYLNNFSNHPLEQKNLKNSITKHTVTSRDSTATSNKQINPLSAMDAYMRLAKVISLD